jgi:hypothetical protein
VDKSGLFVALLSFPRTVLSLKQSTEPKQVQESLVSRVHREREQSTP